jgi:DNA polymerase III epsilon subunit-like protein
MDNIIKLPFGVVIPQECINIHGITNEMSAKRGVDIDTVMSKFMVDIQLVDRIVAHNMNFDYNMIKAEIYRGMNRTYSHFTRRAVDLIERYKGYLYILANLKEKLYCTMKNTISLCNIQITTKTGRTFAKFPKLVELHEKLFGVSPKKLHNSLNDVVVCFRCYYQIEFGTDICIMNSKIQKKILELL